MFTTAFSLFITLFAITNPLGNAAIFVSLTQGVDRSELVKIAIRTGITCYIVLMVSALIGLPLLHAIGVTMNAFMFAGGLILMRVGFSMFGGDTDKSNYNSHEHDAEIGNLTISPLTIPLVAGPGAMVTVIHFINTAHAEFASIHLSFINILVLAVVVAINCLVITGCLYATTVPRFQGLVRKKSVIGVITRICGLLIIAMASAMLLTALQSYLT